MKQQDPVTTPEPNGESFDHHTHVSHDKAAWWVPLLLLLFVLGSVGWWMLDSASFYGSPAHKGISFILVLSVIVFIHEFGHYGVAKLCGVRIETFSIGFGKELFGWNDRSGTRWKVSALPLGGYVKMYGDETAASTPDTDKISAMSEAERKISFYGKALWQKALIVLAGPVANFILAIGMLMYLMSSSGIQTTEPIIGKLVSGSPAAEAGLKSGDRILSIDGKKIELFSDISRMVMLNTGTELSIEYQRGKETLTTRLKPEMREDEDMLGNKITRPVLGVVSQQLTYEDKPISALFFAATEKTYQICAATIGVLGQMIGGDRDTRELSGPLGIMKYTGQAAEKGLETTLWFIALLSANLGLFNLFPIPMLDGGHLMYYTIEAIIRRPIPQKIQEYGFRIGLALLIGLMLLSTANDLIYRFDLF